MVYKITEEWEKIKNVFLYTITRLTSTRSGFTFPKVTEMKDKKNEKPGYWKQRKLMTLS